MTSPAASPLRLPPALLPPARLLLALLLTLPVLAVAGQRPRAYELDVTIHPAANGAGANATWRRRE